MCYSWNKYYTIETIEQKKNGLVNKINNIQKQSGLASVTNWV